MRLILLKNSNFRGDHNSEDRWQPRWKFRQGAQPESDRSFCVRRSLSPCCGKHPWRQRFPRGSGIFAAPQFPTFSTISFYRCRPALRALAPRRGLANHPGGATRRRELRDALAAERYAWAGRPEHWRASTTGPCCRLTLEAHWCRPDRRRGSLLRQGLVNRRKRRLQETCEKRKARRR